MQSTDFADEHRLNSYAPECMAFGVRREFLTYV
jgi:hypothetical protein